MMQRLGFAMRFIRALGLGFLILGLPVRAATPYPGAFGVAGVPVEASAATAVAAHDIARTRGARDAFQRLLERLCPPGAAGRVPHPDDQGIMDLVQDVTVEEERQSPTHYLGLYTYRFSALGVRHILEAANVPFTELASKPVIVLPVLAGPGGNRLWGDGNPWRDAWQLIPGHYGLVPWVVPKGDAADGGAFDGSGAPNPAQIQALSDRYDQGDVVLALATRTGDGGLNVTVTRFGPGGAGDPVSIQIGSAKTDPGLFEAGVVATEEQLESAWKKLTLGDGSGVQSQIVDVSVPLRGAADWAAVRTRLGKIPLVGNVMIRLLAKDEADLRLTLTGNPALIQVAFAQQDLVLDQTTQPARLSLRSRSPTANP
jgi:hypothetical protein